MDSLAVEFTGSKIHQNRVYCIGPAKGFGLPPSPAAISGRKTFRKLFMVLQWVSSTLFTCPMRSTCILHSDSDPPAPRSRGKRSRICSQRPWHRCWGRTMGQTPACAIRPQFWGEASIHFSLQTTHCLSTCHTTSTQKLKSVFLVMLGIVVKPLLWAGYFHPSECFRNCKHINSRVPSVYTLPKYTGHNFLYQFQLWLIPVMPDGPATLSPLPTLQKLTTSLPPGREVSVCLSSSPSKKLMLQLISSC